MDNEKAILRFVLRRLDENKLGKLKTECEMILRALDMPGIAWPDDFFDYLLEDDNA